MSNSPLQSIEEIILARRTSKSFNGEPIEKEKLEKLLELAIRAPNHRLNEPWKFRACTQAGIKKWIGHLNRTLDEEEQKEFFAKFDRMSKLGALIYVTCLKDPKATVNIENYAATCAGIQNILLGATAMGISSFWSTGKLMIHIESAKFLGVKEDENFVGAIWLGYGDKPKASKRTQASDKTVWID